MPAVAQSQLRIVVSSDNLRVELNLKGARVEDVTPASVTERLQELAVVVTDEGAARIQGITKLALEAKRDGQDILLIFRGRKPIPGKPASFKPVEESQAATGKSEDTTFDNRSCKIQTVKAGDLIGEYVPEVPPQSGLDVYGKPIEGMRSIINFELGPNVKFGDDGKRIYATCDGMVRVTRQTVSVVELVQVNGDVDFSSGNVDVPTDVLITGNVAETFFARSPKSITVKGTVEAALVEAGTHVIIAGGVAGKNKAVIRAGGELQAKFLGDAEIEAGSDVIVTKEILNCRIQTRGRLLVPRGPIVGGSAYAREGMDVLTLGNDVDLPTEIAVGILPSAIVKVAELSQIIKKRKEAAAKIRATVQPLLAQLKRLNPQQREKATELMYEADRLDEEASALKKKQDEVLGPYSPSGEQEVCILVNKIVYRGVSLIFGDKITTITKARRGPVKFVSRVVDRVESIIAIDTLSGSTQILPSQAYTPELPDTGDSLVSQGPTTDNAANSQAAQAATDTGKA